jgi:hypothetical protein
MPYNDFRSDSHPVARRIEKKQWESLRPIIVEQYLKGTLESVIEYMGTTHGFLASCVASPPLRFETKHQSLGGGSISIN